MSATKTHYGFIDDQYKPDYFYFFTVDQIHSGGWVLVVFCKFFAKVKPAWVRDLSPSCLSFCKSKCHVGEES